MSTKKTKTYSKKAEKRQYLFNFVVLLGIILLVNVLATRFHFGLDFTKDKRFSITPQTKQLLKNLPEPVNVKVYLKGSFPAGFRKLANATQDVLSNLKQYGGTNFQYEFLDPYEVADNPDEAEIYKFFEKKGIHGVNVRQTETKEGYKEKIIYPYAVVSFKGNDIPVNLLESSYGKSPLEILNYSETLLEYKLASAIKSLSEEHQKEITYITGNGQPFDNTYLELFRHASSKYIIDTFNLNENIDIPNTYAAIIINRPTIPFDEKNKFKIDQYVMNGGRVLWAIDMLNASMDSLNKSQQFITQDYDLNLDDILFQYGVRINRNLIEDLECNQIPVTVGMMGDKPQIELRNWFFYPIVSPYSQHPIVKNIDPVTTQFVSTIDTIGSATINKTVLLASSKYSRATPHPARVNLNMMAVDPNLEKFRSPGLPIAVLVEGPMTSIFKGRIHPTFLSTLRDSLKKEFLSSTGDKISKQIIVSDGDIFKNDFSESMGPQEMGYWKYTRNLFGNRTFFMNALEYLVDDDHLLEARGKELKLRLLDAGRVKKESSFWKGVNIIVPIVLILILGSVYIFFRKRRYAK